MQILVPKILSLRMGRFELTTFHRGRMRFLFWYEYLIELSKKNPYLFKTEAEDSIFMWLSQRFGIKALLL